jgi:hypothetical protein
VAAEQGIENQLNMEILVKRNRSEGTLYLAIIVVFFRNSKARRKSKFQLLILDLIKSNKVEKTIESVMATLYDKGIIIV